jgi:hypothetical protein
MSFMAKWLTLIIKMNLGFIITRKLCVEEDDSRW